MRATIAVVLVAASCASRPPPTVTAPPTPAVAIELDDAAVVSIDATVAAVDAHDAAVAEAPLAASACEGVSADHEGALLLLTDEVRGADGGVEEVHRQIAVNRNTTEFDLPGHRRLRRNEAVLTAGGLGAPNPAMEAAFREGRLLPCGAARCEEVHIDAGPRSPTLLCTASPGGVEMHFRVVPWFPAARVIEHHQGASTEVEVIDTVRAEWSAYGVERQDPNGTWHSIFFAGILPSEHGFHRLVGMYFDPAAPALMVVTEIRTMSGRRQEARWMLVLR